MIFVTVGSQKFQFNRLLKKLDELLEDEIIKDDIFAQIGVCDYKPKHYQYKEFIDRDEFVLKTSNCDVFITHGGTGAIIGALKHGKKIIAVPRLAKYGEHVDDHQIQLLQQFDEMNYIKACYNLDNLGQMYKELPDMKVVPYVSNTQTIINNIEKYILTTQKRGF